MYLARSEHKLPAICKNALSGSGRVRANSGGVVDTDCAPVEDKAGGRLLTANCERRERMWRYVRFDGIILIHEVNKGKAL